MRGLAIQRGGTAEKLPKTWYVEIDHEGAVSLVPHEYGHVLMYSLLPESLHDHAFGHRRTLPHTTGAITNDLTAFTEGWGIHFETLVGDRRENPDHHARLHRDGFRSAQSAALEGDSFFATKDLLSYSQSYRRYTCIKENCFAYLPRTPAAILSGGTPTPTQLRAAWSDTTVDPARLRTLEQMVASEGLVAALFYRLATAPDPAGPKGTPGDPPLPDPKRYEAFFDAFLELTPERVTRTPFVLAFLERLITRAAPAERRRIVHIAAEVFHHAWTVRDAPKIYAELHAAATLLDKRRVREILKTVATRISAGLKQIAQKPAVLTKAAAPELWLVNGQVKLDVPVLGIKELPLALDINTATVPYLMTLPGVSLAKALLVESWRWEHGGFQNLDQFLDTVKLEEARTKIKAMSRPGREPQS
jgi:DNA uptake protein ComE-like DNA-binding protein